MKVTVIVYTIKERLLFLDKFLTGFYGVYGRLIARSEKQKLLH